MPILANVDHGSQAVRATALGRVTVDDIEEHLRLEHHFNGILYPEIIDARAANLDLSYEDARRIVALIRRMCDECKFGPTAVIVSDDVAYGGVRMLEALLSDVAEIAPFRSEAEAQEWLSRRDATTQ